MFRPYRSTRRAEPTPAERGFGIDLGLVVVALGTSVVELLAQLVHGGAWDALPTLALMLALLSAAALSRAAWHAHVARTTRPRHSTQGSP